MTAEIALLNREAIALAADSAVTMSTGSIPKIFSSANKIFTLSKYDPVGIMIYGNAIFMGIPWEIIIKLYRQKINTKSFTTLEGYAKDFLRFLDNGNALFPEDVQEFYIKDSVGGYFNYINTIIKRGIESTLNLKDQIGEDDNDKIIAGVLEAQTRLWDKADKIPNIPDDFETDLINRYNDIIDTSMENCFELLPLSHVQRDQLKRSAISCLARFSKNIRSNNQSGVVIAGFGTDEIYPSLISYDIEVVVLNRLKYKIFNKINISFNSKASVMPFAQSEMVNTFMEGVDPNYRIIKDNYIHQILNRYPEIVASHIHGYSAKEKKELEKKLKEASRQLIEDLTNRLDLYRRENYINPIMNVVAGLPKDELAKMAEALVNLTSFKRRVSQASETVGGPIDVAIISKGDGFIWAKRKHYFSGDLNPQFRENYYRSGEKDERI